ncbi:UDP-N-acetyl-D-mannosamine dehydrogenase [Parerythrobacter jejuensis]|uniref:UDP-N-acetyl-D-mannosamine dehydrogenase n=1 Tax=Parerythrobacter jejuensis TaxID=795812 RepID=A0A845AWT1_9SPHN|nr:UDP-N-acetyl-D-mannosamine dehydrogenase [Parerythrobacter jejuensis]MXP30875.1 UDP-N-acetyl-D-mannosamine dehydrogenase [Parerythrobacter jejuensis]MXP33635.1 UDP-N-acetyl-D-mannosamine dehydrogenase [Parerythrobacter jejuensis]
MIERICVMGLGYIGLPTAALMADSGFDVHGVDLSQHVVDVISDGRVHIVEPDLDALVKRTVETGKLKASTSPAEADVFMLCVPTPFRDGGEYPEPNLDYVLSASRAIAPFLKPGNIVILESTSPVGSTAMVAQELQKAGIEPESISLAYCPERVLPGKILAELVENDRIVGGYTPEATKQVADFYERFVQGEVLRTDAKTAEMCKLTENSFRDVNIAFANELSLLCEREGIDVWELIRLSNHHPRVNILQPGTGVGGHCIAVDPWFIVARDPENAKLIRQAREINDYKTHWVIECIKSAAKVSGDSKIACLGLAFKPDIDDLREAPALRVAETLRASGVATMNVEPNIEQHNELPIHSLDEALDACDIVALLVSHKEFKTEEFMRRLEGKQVFDFCGALQAQN